MMLITFNIENNRYELTGEYDFLEESIKSQRFKDLTLNIRNIKLFESEEDSGIKK